MSITLTWQSTDKPYQEAEGPDGAFYLIRPEANTGYGCFPRWSLTRVEPDGRETFIGTHIGTDDAQAEAAVKRRAKEHARTTAGEPAVTVADLLADYDAFTTRRKEHLEPLAEEAEANPNIYPEYDSLAHDYANDAAELLDALVSAIREERAA